MLLYELFESEQSDNSARLEARIAFNQIKNWFSSNKDTFSGKLLEMPEGSKDYIDLWQNA